jgi:hypothetical protein
MMMNVNVDVVRMGDVIHRCTMTVIVTLANVPIVVKMGNVAALLIAVIAETHSIVSANGAGGTHVQYVKGIM